MEPASTARTSTSQEPPIDLATVRMDDHIPLPLHKLETGVLDNGLTYFVVSNPKPQQRAALALYVRVGSVLETEEERGVAHFLEHLAFSATDLFQHHQLIDFLESAGLAFGACANAYTASDETAFTLLVPLDAEGLLAQALAILAQFACAIRIAPGDVERERGAILEEWRQGRDANGLEFEATWRMLYEGSVYAGRLPIGSEQVIRTVTPETIRGFYARWYRPEHMALVAVGDFSAAQRAEVTALISSAFSGVTVPVGAPPVLPPLPVPSVQPHAEPRVAVQRMDALSETRLSVSFMGPRQALATPRQLRERVIETLFDSALSTRLYRLSRSSSPPWYNASVALDAPVAACSLSELNATVPEGGALPALRELLRQLASIRTQGFSPAELRRARAKQCASLEQLYVEREQEESEEVRDECARHFLAGEAFMDVGTEVRLTLALLADVSDSEVSAVAARLTLRDSCCVRVAYGAAERRPPSEVELRAALSEAVAEEAACVPAGRDADGEESQELMLLRTPPVVSDAAGVASRRQLGDVTELVLRNGLRIALKRTPYLDDQVLLQAFAHGGLSEASRRGGVYESVACAQMLAREAGEFGHEPADLHDLLAGHRCEVWTSLGAFKREWGGEASPVDLGTALALVHALFTTAPAATDDQLAVPLRLTAETIRARRHNPAYQFSTAVKRLNYGGLYFLEPLTLRTLRRVRTPLALAYFDAAFRNPAEFTLCLVGALPAEAELEALLVRYLGTIPAVALPPPRLPHTITPLPWAFPRAATRREVRVPMVEPQAAAQVTWPLTLETDGAPPLSHAEGAALMRAALLVRLACRLLESRLVKTLRFRFGDVYSVSVRPYYGLEAPSAHPPLRGDCAASFTCDPAAAWRLVELALDELAALQADGPTGDECATAVELEKREYELSEEQNSFHASRLAAAYQARDPASLRPAGPPACLRGENNMMRLSYAAKGHAGDHHIKQSIEQTPGPVARSHSARTSALTRASQSKRFNGDVEIYEATAAAVRAEVMSTLTPEVLHAVYNQAFEPARKRYTAVAMMPQRSLKERVAAALSSLTTVLYEEPAATAAVLAGVSMAVAAAALYSRWQRSH